MSKPEGTYMLFLHCEEYCKKHGITVDELVDENMQSEEVQSAINDALSQAAAGRTSIAQLKDGSMQLSDGLKQFSDEGVSKITDIFNGDLSGLAPRMKAMIDVSKRYKSYSGLTDETDGEMKFIYKTEEVK